MDWHALTVEQRDRLVAEKVMGWQPKLCRDEYPVSCSTSFQKPILAAKSCGMTTGAPRPQETRRKRPFARLP